jgi:hypothetical protein
MILPLRIAWLLRRRLDIVDGPPKAPEPCINFEPPKRVVTTFWVHCSASDKPEHDNVATIRRWHLARGFNDIGYHWVIVKSGEVLAGRSVSQIPAAQKGHNNFALAVCVTGKRVFSPAQFEALNELADAVEVAYDYPIRFRGHNEVSSKLCPVFRFREVLGLDQDGFRHGLRGVGPVA